MRASTLDFRGEVGGSPLRRTRGTSNTWTRPDRLQRKLYIFQFRIVGIFYRAVESRLRGGCRAVISVFVSLFLSFYF